MNIYHVRHGSILPLGKQGENMARKIQFDISRWIGTFGPGTVQLLHQRSGDDAPYPVAVEKDGTQAIWTVTNADTAAAGTGRAELQYYVGDALAKSETWMTKVLPALGPASETPPEAQQGWVDQVLSQVARITGMTAQAVELPAGSAPTADYADGVLTIGIPLGGTGLTVTNTAAVGQTIKVSAVDENGQPTEWEAVDMPEQVQADWNQNDSTAADYVKNRTHYEESTYVDYVLNMSGTVITEFSMAEAGETMAVKINGVESAETVKEAESSILGSSSKYIGNIDIDSLINGGTGWCVVDVQEGAVGFANPDTAITVESIVVHKINDKFINFNGLVRTFDYYFEDFKFTPYKVLYNDDGDSCDLYITNNSNIIFPESGSQLFGFMSETGFSEVGSTSPHACFVTGFIINKAHGSITIRNISLGTNTSEIEELAASYGYVNTTNPNA